MNPTLTMSHATMSDSPKEDILANSGERVIKLSLSHLIRNNHEFISVIQNMVVKNMDIAVRGSIIMNYVIIFSVKQIIPLKPDFCKQACLKHVFNWALLPHQISNPIYVR